MLLATQHPWSIQRRETLFKVAQVLADHADSNTGREVRVSNRTIARLLHVQVRTVQRHLRDLSDLGLVHTVEVGRHLTTRERIAVYEATDRVVTRMASTRALTLPREVAQMLPAPQTCTDVTPLRASARSHDLPFVDGTNALRTRRRTTRTTPRTPRKPRSLPLQRLAGRLAARLGWLARARHIGVLCDALTASGVDPELWTASDVCAAVDGWHTTHGRRPLASEASNRLGWLVWALRSAIAEGFTPAATRHHIDAEVRAHRRAQREAQRLADQNQPVVSIADSPAAQMALAIARNSSSQARALRMAKQSQPALVG